MQRIMIVDADPSFRSELARCARAASYAAETAGSPREAVERTARVRCDAAIVDVAAVEELEDLAQIVSAVPVVLAMGAHSSIGLATGALRAGARDFLRKPFALAHFERSLSVEFARGDTLHAAESLGIVTRDPVFRALLHRLRRAAGSKGTLHLVGETGTGKSLLARAVHRWSCFSDEPLEEHLCSGSASEEISAGHECAALERSIDRARGGTLVLCDVAALGIEAQHHFLARLEQAAAGVEGRFPRLIACSSPEPAGSSQPGGLRPELRYRFEVQSFRVPPLRERRSDIPLLAQHFAERFARELDSELPQLGEQLFEALEREAFRGNVQQLENWMRRAVVLYPGGPVDFDSLGGARRAKVPVLDGSYNLKELERRAITRSLTAAGGNRTLASRALGISVRTLRNKIRLYQLR